MTNTPSAHASLPPLPAILLELAGAVDLPDPLDAPPLRWGIIGAGGIAHTFATDVPAHTRSTVAAVAARDQSRADAFAHAHDIPRAYGSYEELVEDPDVDAVYVATIHPRHADNAVLALQAGKPVLVEKSFTMDAPQAHRVLATATDHHLFAMEGMWTRHLPHHRVMKAVLDGGGLGEVVSASADHGQSLRHIARLVDPALGGGALWDLAIYPISFLHAVLGRPETISALARMEGPIDVADAVTVRTRTALGVARANLDGRSATAAEVVCERGALEFPQQFYRPGVLRMRTFPQGGDPDGETCDWDATLPGGFQYEAAEVARCLDAGLIESPVMPWSQTLAVMETLDEVRTQIGLSFVGE